MRLSLDMESGAAYAPFAVFKILIDGSYSQNFHQAHDLVGQQPDQNFFEFDQNNAYPIALPNILSPKVIDPCLSLSRIMSLPTLELLS